MKTLIRKTQSAKKGIYNFFLLITSFLMLAGCEKFEQVQPASSGKSQNQKMIAPPIPPSIMVSIEHNCIGTEQPDYTVMLFSDGSVVFAGRKNVSFIGRIMYKTDEATVSYIKNLFESAHFFQIQQVSFNTLDAPYVVTTYTNEWNSKKLIDFNNGIPQMLIQIRKKTEEKLNVAKYVDRAVLENPAPASF
ncbi:MAG: DUF6438 domain-containing protein [Bacteroidia bacterium]